MLRPRWKTPGSLCNHTLCQRGVAETRNNVCGRRSVNDQTVCMEGAPVFPLIFNRANLPAIILTAAFLIGSGIAAALS